MFAEAMRRIPGNEHFKGGVEFTTVIKYYFGHRAYLLSVISLNGALQALNILSIIQSASALDQAVDHMFGKTCAINLTPFAIDSITPPNSTVCSNSTIIFKNSTVPNSTVYKNITVCSNSNVTQAVLPMSRQFAACYDINGYTDDGNPFGCHVVLSIGFVISLLLVIPMGYFNLDDNMIVQQVCFVLTILCWLVWILVSFGAKSSFNLPAVNSDSNTGSQAAVVGTVLFNFGFVCTVPSWINEKRRDVGINSTVWISTIACNFIFFIIGIPGCIAFSDYLQGPTTNTCHQQAVIDSSYNCANSLLDIFTGGNPNIPNFMQEPAGNFIVQLSVYLFPIVAILSSIPVFSIVIKYNCLENGLSPVLSNFWGIIFPWVVALPLMQMPNAFNIVLQFSSNIFVAFTDFILPCCLYYVLQRGDSYPKYDDYSSLVNSNEFMEGNEDSPDLEDNIHIHYAIPSSWNLSPKSKMVVALVVGIMLAAFSVTGIVLYTLGINAIDWDCAAVGSNS